MIFFKKKQIGEERDGDMAFVEQDNAYVPLDVFEKDGLLYTVTPLAGVDIDDVKVVIDGDTLTISGERSYSESVDENDYHCQECYWGSVNRSIVLPCKVKKSGVKASMKKGILTIIIPIDGDSGNGVTTIRV